MRNNIPLYIAFRYLFAKKGSTAVSLITGLATLAMTVAVASMLIILSVFSGLEIINQEMIKNINSDIIIKSEEGKTLSKIERLEDIIKKNKRIKAFSKQIEEKVFIEYDGKGEIAKLRAVDERYTAVNPINQMVFLGEYPSYKYENEAIMEFGLNNKLSIPVGSDVREYATLYVPKGGTGIITQQEDIFNKKEVYITGVFPAGEQMSHYIISPIELAQNLLNLPKGAAYSIVIKLHNESDAEAVREEIIAQIGDAERYSIKTKKEMNAAFWKMINIEKLFVYLIFGLVIFITTFNLAGAIIILKLDKRDQTKVLYSIGISSAGNRNIFFYTGTLITLLGSFFGLVLGTLICYFQIRTEFFMANETTPFPVKLIGRNYLYILGLALFFGIPVSWLFSRNKNKERMV